jgi:hypothetical protein
VRILLDECVPRPLLRAFVGLDVAHVIDLGWAGRKNGRLLASMRESGFDALVTVDRNLEFQQHLPAAGIVVVAMYAHTNRVSELKPLLPEVIAVLATALPGMVYRVGA